MTEDRAWHTVIKSPVISQEHTVEGLCWGLPVRVESLRLEKGDGLPK